MFYAQSASTNRTGDANRTDYITHSERRRAGEGGMEREEGEVEREGWRELEHFIIV